MAVMEEKPRISGDQNNITVADPEKSSNIVDSQANTTDEDAPAKVPFTDQERHEAQMQRWNHPRINLWRFLAANWSFILMGANDGAIGALIPYVQSPFTLHPQPSTNAFRSNHTTTSPTQSSPSSS